MINATKTKTENETTKKIIKVAIIEDFKLHSSSKTTLYDFIIINENREIFFKESTVKLKEMFPDMKVIALTSHDRGEEVVAALSSGASAYCLKDIDPEKLANVIRDVNEGVCWIDPVVSQLALNSFPKSDNLNLLQNKHQDETMVPLTEREYEVLKHLVTGKSNTEIAKELIVSVHTAKAHVCSILQKMCVNDRVQAAVKAVREGLV